MVKRKRIVQQNNQDERNEDGATRSSEVAAREDAKATDNRNVGGEPSTVADPGNSSVMCGTRSRSQLSAGRNPQQNPQTTTDSPVTATPTVGDVKAAAVPRSSARVPCKKRLRKESVSSTPAASKNSAQLSRKNSPQPAVKIKKNGKKVTTRPDQLRTRRSWELWSVEDKNAFFEALCEYGKDFENIQLYIAQKSKKKGLPPNMIKNKDQVRFFYYRTWHKISKFLDVGEDIKKPTLELYGLVNYAELRKKKGGCGLLNVKNQQKLNELVTRGETTFKYKGKKLKVRTPVCRALKKLNNIEDTKEPEIPRLPKEIEVEFRPKTNAAWMHVQNMAQNPRVKTKIGLHKRLSTLLAYMEKRWKPYRLRQKEKILETMPELASTTVANEKMPNIRVSLIKDVTLCMLSVTSIDTACSEDVCLDNYIKGLAMSERLKESAKDAGKPKKPVRTRILPLNAMQNKISSQNTEENCSESNADAKKLEKKLGELEETDAKVADEPEEMGIVREDNCALTDPEIEAERSLSLLKNMIQSIAPAVGNISALESKPNEAEPIKNVERDESPAISLAPEKASENTCPAALDLFLANQSENKNLTFGQFLSLTESEDNKEIESVNDPEKKLDVEDENKRAENLEKINKKKEELMNKIRKGWTREECRTLTIGELYLMLNHPEKIVLEYDFEVLGDPQVKVMPDSELEAVRIPKHLRVHHLAEILKTLVSVSSHYFTDFKVKPNPISPTTRVQSKSTATPTQSKSTGGTRGNARNQGGVKAANNAKANKCVPTEVNATLASTERPSEPVAASATTSAPTVNRIAVNDSVSIDKHQFAMPVRAAPRPFKISTSNPRNDSVMQQLDKLVDLQRRNNRSRNRRSLVVPRPLLPSTADNSGMTVVHLLPSGGSLSPLTVTNVGGVRKIILPKQQTVLSKSAIGLTPVQILNPVAPTPRGLMFPTASLTTTRVVVGSNASPTVISNPAVHAVVTTVQSVITPSTLAVSNSVNNVAISENALLSLQTPLDGTPNSKISISPLSLNVITNDGQVQRTIGNLRITTGSGNSPPQISIPESQSATSSLQISSQSSSQSSSFNPTICSLLDLSEGLNQIPHPVTDQLLDFNSNSSISSTFGLSTKSSSSNTHLLPLIKQARTSDNDPLVSNRIQATPPLSPNGSRFKVNSPGPETNWLNGESSDFSLSSLLNTFESPVKNIQCGPSDGSTLDAMSRLGPDVDNNLQCLINESSVDYVAKFADLAAQIASTATENKCT